MHPAWQGFSAALAVMAVSMAARLGGRRLAGAVAGLPVVSLPSLVWLGSTQGTGFAAQAALGSLLACAASPVQAWLWVRLLPRWGLLGAGVASVAAWVALVQALRAAQLSPAMAWVAVMIVTVPLARRGQAADASAAVVPRWRGQVWWCAAAAGVLCALIGWLAPRIGPHWSGALAAMPLVGMMSLLAVWATGDLPALPRFVRGYAGGVLAKALFLLALSQALGVLPLASAVLCSVVVMGLAMGAWRGVARAHSARRRQGSVSRA